MDPYPIRPEKKTESTPLFQYKTCLVAVNEVSTDHAGEFYASCSNDGRKYFHAYLILEG